MSESNTPLQNTTNSSRKEGREGEKDKNKQNKQKKTTAEHVDSALVSNHTEQHTKAVQGEENKEKTRDTMARSTTDWPLLSTEKKNYKKKKNYTEL